MQTNQANATDLAELAQVARERNWGLSLLLAGWLHLLAFLACYLLTIELGYHEAPAYVLLWTGELLGIWLIFRTCGGGRPSTTLVLPLELTIRRIWTVYLLMAFNLGTLNALRGHALFEFFPAAAPLASFAFLMMTMLIDRRFIAGALVMFVSGLLMAGNLLHAYLVFALAWWLVLNVVGFALWRDRRRDGRVSKVAKAVRERGTKVHVPLKTPN